MKTVIKYVRAMVRTPKTSIPGVVGVLGAIGMLVHNPMALLTDQVQATAIVTALFAGIGLLFSADVEVEAKK